MKKIWVPLSLIVLLAGGFQNCSKAQFNGSQDSNELSLAITGFRPALAVRNTVCMNCHSNVSGNMITDFDQANGVTHFMDTSMDGSGGEYMYPNYAYASRSFWGTGTVSGTIYVPNSTLDAAAQAYAATVVAEGKMNLNTIPEMSAYGGGATDPVPATPGFPASTLAQPTTIAQYLNAVLNGRTSAFRQFIAAFPGISNIVSIIPDTGIQEVQSVKIGSPSAATIRALIPAGQPYTFVEGKSTIPLAGLKLSANGKFYQNDPSTNFVCDGDLFIDAPLVLINLQLQTQTGCRIHTTGSIFLQGPQPNSANGGQGIAYIGGSSPNLQLTSAVGIEVGMGACSAAGLASGGDSWATAAEGSLGGRMRIPYGRIDLLTPIESDYKNIVDTSGNQILSDAGDCAAATSPLRKIALQHLLLNAPRIDSRYSGAFSGVIIAEFFMGSLGGVSYSYDPVFDDVSIFPKLTENAIFNVQLCSGTTAVDNNLSTCK